MKKEFTKIKDFIEDVSFNRWIVEKSEQDRLRWEEWLISHPEKKELLEDAASILIGIQFQTSFPSEAKIEAKLNLLHRSIAAKEATYKPPKQIERSFYRKNIWSIAAAITLLVTITLSIPYFLQDNFIKHQTAFGELKDIQMPDGSKIALNANSILKYEAANPRKVWLEGEAFFEVAKQPKTGENFQVLTNDLTVEVLGTIFNVKNRNQETKVFLEEGKVVLAMEEQVKKTIEMNPGELVSYSKKQQKIIAQRTSKAINNTSWKDGVLRFEEAPLVEALAEVSVIYGIEFEVKDEKATDQLFSGGVPIQNKAIVLAALREVFEIEITQAAEKYIVQQKK